VKKGISQFLVIVFIFVDNFMPDRLGSNKIWLSHFSILLKIAYKISNLYNIFITKNWLTPFFTNTVLLYILYLRYYTHENNYNIILVMFIDDHSSHVTSRYGYTRSYFG